MNAAAGSERSMPVCRMIDQASPMLSAAMIDTSTEAGRTAPVPGRPIVTGMAWSPIMSRYAQTHAERRYGREPDRRGAIRSKFSRCHAPRCTIREAINASGALKRPRRSDGGNTASIASSFSDGSICR